MIDVAAGIAMTEEALPAEVRSVVTFEEIAEATRAALLEVAMELGGTALVAAVERGKTPESKLFANEFQDVYLNGIAARLARTYDRVVNIELLLNAQAKQDNNPEVAPPGNFATPLFYQVPGYEYQTPLYTAPWRFANEIAAYRGAMAEASAMLPNAFLTSAQEAGAFVANAVASAGEGAANRLADAAKAMAEGAANFAAGVGRPLLVGLGIGLAALGVGYVVVKRASK